jgi:hypothetical protein
MGESGGYKSAEVLPELLKMEGKKGERSLSGGINLVGV